MGNNFSVVNVSELSPAKDYFLPPGEITLGEWVNFSGLPKGWPERLIKRPKISRYRAAIQAARHVATSENAVVISHMPSMTAAVSCLLSVLGIKHRHIAFAFNFTKIPSSIKKTYLKLAFRGVDGFVVYSEYERDLYSKAFGIPLDKIKSTLWTQDVPRIKEGCAPVFDEPYLCAIGGEGRDFSCLIEAARVSGVKLAVVARPHSLLGISIPENVKVFENMPIEETWALAKNSCGVVIPLLSKETCCGQITVVSAQMLGLPIVSNPTYALKEYFSDDGVSLFCESGDVFSLAEKMTFLLKNSAELLQESGRISGFYIKKYQKSLWIDALNDVIEKLGSVKS